jgi:hypothetical protein
MINGFRNNFLLPCYLNHRLWTEGNMLEPDFKYGHGYLKSIREALDQLKK